MTKEDYCKEELRDEFLVSEKTKKIWYTEMELYKEFDTFCKKYNLRYYADYGTLLGAVRHQGFIPWDDDMDFSMLRPDYQRMLELAPVYFRDPYYFQNYHTETSATKVYNFSRLRDERTTCLRSRMDETRNDHPGIFIDIFPLDAAPPFKVTSNPGGVFGIVLDIWLATAEPRTLLEQIINGYTPEAGIDTMLDILGLPFADRLSLYESILTEAFDKADMINYFSSISSIMPCSKAWYAETIELPFEYISLPAPKEYDQILRTYYGDYMEPVMYASDHAFGLVDPDHPYTDYINDSNIR